MWFIRKSLKVAQKFNVWEISFFKFYLVTVAFILSIWFPVLLTANLWVYIIAAFVLLALIFKIMIAQQGNFYKKMFALWFWVHLFKKMDMVDMSIFKLTMVSIGFLIAKLFPVLLSAHIAWYIAVACLFIWYYFHWVFSRK
jgi:hypothetical protein